MVEQKTVPELHFSRNEYAQRIANARKVLKNKKLDALLVFSQESHYYLTGFDTAGYVFFQCAVITTDEQPITLLTRRPDVQQAKETSVISDIRVWYDAEGANPANDLRDILSEKGLAGCRIGIELNTYGLTGLSYDKVLNALKNWCLLEDASDVVRGLRLIKSSAELEYVRQAAHISDAALVEMIQSSRPHTLDTIVTAAGLNSMLSKGGDVPPAGPLVNCGHRALYGRSVAGSHVIKDKDQVTIEFASSYRRYTTCIMRTVVVGEVFSVQRDMFNIVSDAINAMTDAAAPNMPLGSIDDAHRRVFDEAGHKVHRYSACGYSLGATFRPSWMDVPPMIYSGNPLLCEPGMVFFLHAMLANTDAGYAMSFGHTLLITDSGSEVLSSLPVELPSIS
jgi:Xaa-Pro dipeptidase